MNAQLKSECLTAEVDLACGFNLRSLIFRDQYEVIEQPSVKLAPKSSGDPKTFPHGRVTDRCIQKLATEVTPSKKVSQRLILRSRITQIYTR